MEEPLAISTSRKILIVSGCIFIPVLIVIALIVAVNLWNSFVAYGMASDLTDYYSTINSSELDPEIKRPLLERIDNLRHKARERPISFWRWLAYAESIESIINDRSVTIDEVETLKRELDRLEKEFE